MTKLQKKSGQAGFTLIEIIAVLVILAVLAAVAIPQYINLMNDARQSALQGAIAAAQSQCSLTYSSLLLTTGATPSASDVAAQIATDGSLPAAPGEGVDFGYALVAAGNTITITATDIAGESRPGSWTTP